MPRGRGGNHADHRTRSLADAVLRGRPVSRGRPDPHGRRARLRALPGAPLDLQQVADLRLAVDRRELRTGSQRATFPVFSKPIYNMQGMGVGGATFSSAEELEAEPDRGAHVDAQARGRARLDRRGGPGRRGPVVAPHDGQRRWATASSTTGPCWPRTGPRSKTTVELGCASTCAATAAPSIVETIGGTLIEVHLRFADQWPDLYGAGWLDAIVELYTRRRWRYPDDDRRDGWSVVLFGAHGVAYQAPPARTAGGHPRAAGRSRASRSRSTRTCRPSSTPCPRAASAWQSSIARTSTPG